MEHHPPDASGGFGGLSVAGDVPHPGAHLACGARCWGTLDLDPGHIGTSTEKTMDDVRTLWD